MFRWWICPGFKEDNENTNDNRRAYLSSRYLMSDLLIGELIDDIVNQKMSPTLWCQKKVATYVEYARQIWISNGDRYERLNKEVMQTEIKSFFGVDTIKRIITEIGMI